jgi:hypothetical protein
MDFMMVSQCSRGCGPAAIPAADTERDAIANRRVFLNTYYDQLPNSLGLSLLLMHSFVSLFLAHPSVWESEIASILGVFRPFIKLQIAQRERYRGPTQQVCMRAFVDCNHQ